MSMFVAEHRRVVAAIPPHLRGLLVYNTARVARAVQAGLTSVTWDAPDIDGYVMGVAKELQALEVRGRGGGRGSGRGSGCG